MGHRESHGKELPTPAPSAKIAASLDDSFEYAGIWTGQSNSLPWGDPNDAIDPLQGGYALELGLQPPGQDLVDVDIPDNPSRGVGTVELIPFLSDPIAADIWNKSTWLRLGTVTDPKPGYAEVLRSEVAALTVRWITLPNNNQSVQGYLVRENGKWYSYENCRQLTPFLPLRTDIQPGRVVGDESGMQSLGFRPWETPIHSEYPTPGAPLAEGGQSLILPNQANGQAPASVVPPDVTVFDDLALYLPMTRREGAEGYGFSDIADALFDNTLTGASAEVPTPHPISQISTVQVGGEDFTLFQFINEIDAEADMTAAYVLIDWEDRSMTPAVPKRSWGRVTDVYSGTPSAGVPPANTVTSFRVQESTWLGDGEPVLPPPGVPTGDDGTSVITESTHGYSDGDRIFLQNSDVPPASAATAVTFDDATNRVDYGATAHGLVNGQQVYFTGGGLPAGITAGTVYFVRNKTNTDYQISAERNSAVLTWGVAGSGDAFEVVVEYGRPYVVVKVDDDSYQLKPSPDHPVLTWSTTGAWPAGKSTLVFAYTVWLPHWKDNPFMWIPGPEFAYPNEDQQPRNTFVKWRARGQLIYAWNNQPGLPGFANAPKAPYDGVADSRFGAELPFCWRVGVAIGRPLRMVSIGIGSTPLAPAHVTNNAAGVFTGTVGWWNHERLGYAVLLEDSTSYLAKRLKRLLTFMAHQALIAEGETKTLKYLTAVHIQGEADGFTEAGRSFYSAFVNDYRQWLRDIVKDGGWSPFEGEAELPFAQPLISYDEYISESGLAWNDREDEINNHLKEIHTQDEFSGFVLVDDLPKENAGHYSGGGMAVLGSRLAVSILDNLEHALAYGSPGLSSVNDRLLRIANNALLYVGQGANTIKSLTEGTTEANLVAAMLPQATEDVLEMRPWTFATRREKAASLKHDHPEWRYCYAVPGRAMAIIEIIPPTTEEGELPAENRFLPVTLTQSNFSANVVERDRFLMGRRPAPFVTEASISGNELLFTNVEETPPDLSQPIPFPNNDLKPERLPNSPTLKYIDKQIDPDRYSAAFSTALTWYLASMLAPALIKGPEGEAAAARHLAKASGFVRTAAAREGMMHEVQPFHEPDWIRARR